MNDKKTKIILNVLFVVFLLLVVANRFLIYFLVNFNYIDNDQPIMWLGTVDFSKGDFYEPRFYGQNYNTMLEALLAVPFYKMGIPTYKCVPAVTHVLALFPFIFTSFYLFFKKKKESAIIVLGGLLCLTTGYDIVTGIPRGFVTGIFFTSFFILSLYNPKNYKYLLLNSFLAYVAYLVNPNSVIVSVPCLFYLWLLNFSDKKFYIYAFVGFVLALPIDYGLNHFYRMHPNYIVHGGESYFGISYFKDAITHINARFAHISPFIDQQGVTLLIAFLIALTVFFKKNKNLFYSMLLTLFIVLVSFSYSKTQDGNTWVFYSFSRMYIGIPLLLLLFISLLNIKTNKFFYLFIVVVFLFSGFKLAKFKKRIAFHTDKNIRDRMLIVSLKEMKESIEHFKAIAKQQHVTDIIFVENYWQQDFAVYAGSVLTDNYPNTLNPHYDRRYWRFQEEDTTIRKTFLLFCGNNSFFNTHKIPSGKLTQIDEWGLYLVTENTLTTIDFLKKAGFNVIPFKD
ncbi:MAG: hypothetical protein ABI388_03025 [Bacteroidia bacterium]